MTSLGGSAPASADAYINACGARTTTAAFAGFGDPNQYFEVPGAHFEFLSLNGWTTSGASLVSGNEPWRVLGPLDSRSLRLAPGGYAQPPAVCVAAGEDSLRLFHKAPGVAGAKLTVKVTATSGASVAVTTYTIDGASSGWAVSNRLPLPNVIDTTGTQYLTISIAATGTPAAWQLDDVLVDPWRTR